ncbi:hypothetical protein [uncultured Desulfosarcina sp.]|uniref:hypothetical protein n=1 Tax=uncultured Desulfosarcina sp. TaxID=218289 RepID=UPI0029C77C50|nr:hypothetical protein [uncultured Desulfosarcina sp.]
MDIKVIAVSIIALIVAGSILYVGLWKLFYIDLTKSRWKEAKADYPRLAKKMNLVFKPGELNYHIGEISGVFNTFQVAVKPDDSATIEIRFKSTPDLFLSSIDLDNNDPFPGMVRFDTENPAFDQYFLTRFATPAISSALKEKSSALQFVDIFVKKWADPIQRFDISRNGIECRFKYGGQTYIPTSALESLLPELCNFAETFEAMLPRASHQEISQRDGNVVGGAADE